MFSFITAAALLSSAACLSAPRSTPPAAFAQQARAPPVTAEALARARDVDIVDVACQLCGVDVSPLGKALCPFHDERTPSCSFNSARNLFKCFGCGAGGDGIALYRRCASF